MCRLEGEQQKKKKKKSPRNHFFRFVYLSAARRKHSKRHRRKELSRLSESSALLQPTMLLRKLQDRATGRRVSEGVGVPRANEGIDGGPQMSSSPTTTPPPSPLPLLSPSFSNSLAASADLAPRLRVVSTCDGHEGCVNSVSFAGERGERLVTGTRRVLFFLSLSVRGRAKERERERDPGDVFLTR